MHGFFVNESTELRFQPNPSSLPGTFSHSLVALLERLSGQFKSNFVNLSNLIAANAIAYSDTPSQVFPWITSIPSNRHYAGSGYHIGASTFGNGGFLSVDAIDNLNLRDFNDDLQQARELPRETITDRIIRDRRLQQIQADFINVATKGAIAVVEGNLPSMNPQDPLRSRMFLFNNIFFSFALDTRDSFTKIGGDEAARVAAGKDLAATKAWNIVDPSGIYLPASALIDYKGHRVVAQSMIPGMYFCVFIEFPYKFERYSSVARRRITGDLRISGRIQDDQVGSVFSGSSFRCYQRTPYCRP